jgi:hypothetical protein
MKLTAIFIAFSLFLSSALCQLPTANFPFPTPSPTFRLNGSCADLNLPYNGCCNIEQTRCVTEDGCRCDIGCFFSSDCCSDIYDIGCNINAIPSVQPNLNGSCLMLNLNYSGCCNASMNNSCFINGCGCDMDCHTYGDCCNDINSIGCVFNNMSNATFPNATVTPPTPGLCASLNLTGCCNTSTMVCDAGGCFCDTGCQLTGDCCSDIFDIGCGNSSLRGSCRSLNLNGTGCCDATNRNCTSYNCSCSASCYVEGNCCDDIESIGCYRPVVIDTSTTQMGEFIAIIITLSL